MPKYIKADQFLSAWGSNRGSFLGLVEEFGNMQIKCQKGSEIIDYSEIYSIAPGLVDAHSWFW